MPSSMVLNKGITTPRNAIPDSGMPLRLSSVTSGGKASMMASRQHASTLITTVGWIREIRVCSGIHPYRRKRAMNIAKASCAATT